MDTRPREVISRPSDFFNLPISAPIAEETVANSYKIAWTKTDKGHYALCYWDGSNTEWAEIPFIKNLKK